MRETMAIPTGQLVEIITAGEVKVGDQIWFRGPGPQGEIVVVRDMVFGRADNLGERSVSLEVLNEETQFVRAIRGGDEHQTVYRLIEGT